jgi:hypothetical protein
VSEKITASRHGSKNRGKVVVGDFISVPRKFLRKPVEG